MDFLKIGGNGMKEHNNKDNVVGVISGTLLDMEELMFKGDDGVYQ